ncbi:hypothetical protein PM082_006171 [Marasmius tenuissimus]|nr:hypothetical protein PM082_006171 [Marasmius tenuissimus]
MDEMCESGGFRCYPRPGQPGLQRAASYLFVDVRMIIRVAGGSSSTKVFVLEDVARKGIGQSRPATVQDMVGERVIE